VVSAETFKVVNSHVWSTLWRWCRRRHKNKGGHWIASKYFTSKEGRNWVFFGDCPNGRRRLLFQIGAVRIRRHQPVKLDANPYDAKWLSYFQARDNKTVDDSHCIPRVVRQLWWRQKGMCPHCGLSLGNFTEWGIFKCDLDQHHIVPRAEGGSDELANLWLLHSNCHRQLHVVATP
jgi:RNA-directed DNA polymerase